MQRYIIRRIGHAVLALLAISIIIFSLTRITGDPVDVLLPEDADVEDIARARELWGLDKPLHEESIKWPGQDSFDLIIQRMPATLQLSGFSLLLAALMALPIGVMVAVKKDTGWDYAGKIFALLGQSMPSFWLGLMLMWIFAVHLEWFPPSGRGTFMHMLLPGFALGYLPIAAVMRLTRSSMLEVLDTEYVKLARIKGVSERKVIWKHCLRNAAIAPLTYFGLILGGSITGSVVIETVFDWPGVGLLAIRALGSRDFTVVQSVVLFFAVIYIVCNLMVDILYAYLDPRIRYN